MNIFVISDAFWPDYTGGITKSLLTEVEELVARGHCVTVATRKIKPNLPFYEYKDGYHLYRYPSPSESSIFSMFFPLFSLTHISKLTAQLQKKYHFDVAYVHNIFQAVGLIRSTDRIPYVYVFHAPAPLEIKIEITQGKYGWKAPLVRMANLWVRAIERKALLKAEAIIVRSKFMGRQIQTLYSQLTPRKNVQIPLGINIKKFEFILNRKDTRKKLDLPYNRPLLLTVRRLAARMGLENLILAMCIVKNRIHNVILLIAGKGYLEEKLKAMIQNLQLQNHIRMLGFVPEEKLPQYYQTSDLFILPTLSLEGFGLSTLEALACGTPVIATPIGANPEVIGPLDRRLLCDDITPKSIAERIIWWLTRGIDSEFRKQCHTYCKTHFDIKPVVNSIEKLLRNNKK